MSQKPSLTQKQMKARYPNQWLLIADYELDATTSLRKGRVVAHSEGREEIHHALKEHSGNLCIHFTGDLPRDTGVLFPMPRVTYNPSSSVVVVDCLLESADGAFSLVPAASAVA
jgi:hypothetical protein